MHMLRGLRRRSPAARLLRSWVRIPPGHGCSSVVCCVLSGSLCNELITRPEESYRLWCAVVWSRNLKNEEAMTLVGSQRHRRKIYINTYTHKVYSFYKSPQNRTGGKAEGLNIFMHGVPKQWTTESNSAKNRAHELHVQQHSIHTL